MNEPKFPVLHLEKSGDIFSLKRGKAPCLCHMKPPVPVHAKLGGIEMIGSPCSSTCPMFNVLEGVSGTASVSLHCASQPLKHELLPVVNPEPGKSPIIH